MEDIILEKLAELKSISLLAAKNVLTIDDVALLTGYSKQHIYHLVCNRQIPYYKPTGKNLFFKKEDVEQALLRVRINSVEETEQAAIAYCESNK